MQKIKMAAIDRAVYDTNKVDRRTKKSDNYDCT